MATIASNQAAIAAADTKIILTETSGYPIFDGTHFDMTPLLTVGADMFDAVKSRILAM